MKVKNTTSGIPKITSLYIVARYLIMLLLLLIAKYRKKPSIKLKIKEITLINIVNKKPLNIRLDLSASAERSKLLLPGYK